MSYEMWIGVVLLFAMLFFIIKVLDTSNKLSEKQVVLMKDLLDQTKDLLDQTKITTEYVIEIDKNLRGEYYLDEIERGEGTPNTNKRKERNKIK